MISTETLTTWKPSNAQPIQAQTLSSRSKARPAASGRLMVYPPLATLQAAASVPDNQRFDLTHLLGAHLAAQSIEAGLIRRSEERRVGKECRSRWSPYH